MSIKKLIIPIAVIAIIVAGISIFIFQEPNDKVWKTFKNTKYGFSFKYPSDWKIQIKKKDEATLYSDKFDFQFITTTKNGSTIFSGYKIDSKEEIKVAGEKAIKIFSSGGNPPDDSYTTPLPPDYKIIEVDFTKNNITHQIIIRNVNEYAVVSDPVYMEEIFNLILKTIKFE
ncbi:MAG: hypothetical protein ABIA17_06570 [Elusimicrobiota bacterium]